MQCGSCPALTHRQNFAKREKTMWNLIVFAAIGLLAGAAARLFFPGRRTSRILITMIIGMIGALGGGMFSWIWWPLVDGEFHSGNLIMSILAATIAIVVGAGVAYQRSLGGHSNLSG
jgi:uncharacterized membrane protein YeaQ/YmgE (transglycosylase-associated protein family)